MQKLRTYDKVTASDQASLTCGTLDVRSTPIWSIYVVEFKVVRENSGYCVQCIFSI